MRPTSASANATVPGEATLMECRRLATTRSHGRQLVAAVTAAPADDRDTIVADFNRYDNFYCCARTNREVITSIHDLRIPSVAIIFWNVIAPANSRTSEEPNGRSRTRSRGWNAEYPDRSTADAGGRREPAQLHQGRAVP